MEIAYYSVDALKHSVDEFVRNDLIYGNGSEFKSLVTPTSVIISRDETRDLDCDLEKLWGLYRTWNQLYIDSIDGDAHKRIRRNCEYGLNESEIEVMRIVSRSRLEPRMTRIDYVTLGEDRKVAEVQWKSGGPGLFFGIQDVLSRTVEQGNGSESMGNLVDAFYRLICEKCRDEDSVAVNDIRGGWTRGEEYLRKAYENRRLIYLPVDRAEISSMIKQSGNNFFIRLDGKDYKIGFFYGYGWETFSKERLIALAEGSVRGDIWIESPLNYIYREKWGMAMPFMREYKDMFDDRLRDILIPTALIDSTSIDLSPIVPHIEHRERERLLDVKSFEDFGDLGESLRKKLVFKCGSGTGDFYNRSRGVFRITGSRKAAENTLIIVKERVCEGEPWIVQEYIDRKYPVDMRLPYEIETPEIVNAHARFMIFGGMFGDEVGAMGGIGNFGRHWKVSGKAPVAGMGTQTGTAFNDMRVRKYR
jgi:hypothetical protein